MEATKKTAKEKMKATKRTSKKVFKRFWDGATPTGPLLSERIEEKEAEKDDRRRESKYGFNQSVSTMERLTAPSRAEKKVVKMAEKKESAAMKMLAKAQERAQKAKDTAQAKTAAAGAKNALTPTVSIVTEPFPQYDEETAQSLSEDEVTAESFPMPPSNTKPTGAPAKPAIEYAVKPLSDVLAYAVEDMEFFQAKLSRPGMTASKSSINVSSVKGGETIDFDALQERMDKFVVMYYDWSGEFDPEKEIRILTKMEPKEKIAEVTELEVGKGVPTTKIPDCGL